MSLIPVKLSFCIENVKIMLHKQPVLTALFLNALLPVKDWTWNQYVPVEVSCTSDITVWDSLSMNILMYCTSIDCSSCKVAENK